MSRSPDTDWITETVTGLAPLATAKETAAVLRTSTRNLRRMIGDGRIRAVRAQESGSSPVLVPRGEIERYLRGLVSP
ncbi:MAG TPA: helix-turn-helix domain-containing protein [Polyangiaceae bacterium]